MIDRIHGGNCLKSNIIDFSVNINPLGLPEGVRNIIAKNIDVVLHYPEPSSAKLKRKLSLSHGVGQENIAIGNGSVEFIHLIPRAFKIKKVIIITPTFSEYEFAVKANGSMPIFFNTSEKDDFKIDYDKLAKLLPHCDALFLCNPNNPTGSILHSDEVLYLFNLSKKQGTILILDEAFIEFVRGLDETAIASAAVKNGSLLILRSLTKFFAIPGLRLGYVIGHKRIIEKVSKLQYPWNVNSLAQLAGEKALEDKVYMDRNRLFVAKERQHMFKRLGSIKGLKAYPSSANFILCKLQNTQIKNSNELTRRLLRDDIYIRACGNFRGLNDKFFRVAVRKRDDNNRLINSMEKVLR